MGSSPLNQPLSCFRGLLGIFFPLSLPLTQTADIVCEPERERAESLSSHCAAADTGQGRAKLLCLGLIILSCETRDSPDGCQGGHAAPCSGRAGTSGHLHPGDHEEKMLRSS